MAVLEVKTVVAENESLSSKLELQRKELINIALSITEQERQLTTLLRLGFSSKHIAALMNISPKSIEMSRYRLRNKLALNHEQKLTTYIKNI